MSGERDGWRERESFRKRLRLVTVLVVALLSLSTMFGAWRCSTRSSNALDELYYATIDSNAYGALMNGFSSPDVLLSAISTVKTQDVRAMKNVDMGKKSSFSHGIAEFPTGIESGLDYVLNDKSAYDVGVRSISWGAWDSWDLGSSWRRGVEFSVSFPIEDYGSDVGGTASVNLAYDPDRRALSVRPYESYVRRSEKNKESELSNVGYIQRHHVDVESMADDAISIVKNTVLKEFLARRGSMSKFSPNFEQDGVVVDIDLSSS